MKSRHIKQFSLALAAALLIGGCAAQPATASAAGAPPFETAVTGATQRPNAPFTQAVGTVATAQPYVFSDVFSDRDLSAAYDASQAVAVTLNGTTAQAESAAVKIDGANITITAAGTYVLSGTLDHGSVTVNAGKEDKVQLVFNGVSIRSDSFAALYVLQADKVFVTLAEHTTNSLSTDGAFVPIDENDVDAVIYAKDDITLNGTGALKISSPAGHGIAGKDEMTITGGSYEIVAANSAIRAKDSIAVADGTFLLTAGGDGLHAENQDDQTLGGIYITGGSFTVQAADDAIHATTLLQIDGGSFLLTAAEGLEATYIKLNGGEINISASDDGINTAAKSSLYAPTVEINGGTLNIAMGAGDTDGVDSNGHVIINGGAVNVTGRSTFDYDGTAQYNGGTVTVNGQTVNTIPNQMMGGGMGGGRHRR